MEAAVTGILGKLYVYHTVHGARVVARSLHLTDNCASDEEIEDGIRMLKDDLDACGREMRRLLRLNRSGSLFEGWPSAADEVRQR
jgi:hypothetical protein